MRDLAGASKRFSAVPLDHRILIGGPSRVLKSRSAAPSNSLQLHEPPGCDTYMV